MGYILLGISCALLGYIIVSSWKTDQETPDGVRLLGIFLPLLASFLIRKAKKNDPGNQ
jgi:hypothetical protein